MARDRLVSNALEDLAINHETELRVDNDRCFGSRIRIDPHGHLMITFQDHVLICEASDLPTAIGSIFRATTDGEAPINALMGNGRRAVALNDIIAASSTGWRWAATAANHHIG